MKTKDAAERAKGIVQETGAKPGEALHQARQEARPVDVGSRPWVDSDLQIQLVRHKGKKVAFNAGRHRMKGTVVSIDERMHRVYIDVEAGLEPGIHTFIISRLSNFAFLRD